MRILFFTDYYSECMGYSENLLPRLMAARGHEVYLVASTMQVYGDEPFYEKVYGSFLGPRVVPAYRRTVNGVHVIRLPILCWWKRFRLSRGALRTIAAIRPDIVQTFNPRAMSTLLIAALSYVRPFRLFTSEHSVASVYSAYHSFDQWSLAQRVYLRLTDTYLGRLACHRLVKCYATTADAAEIAERFHGVRHDAIRLLPLGVDTLLFHPVVSPDDQKERQALRSSLSIGPDELLCIYTGRFTAAKNPRCLAAAVAQLRARGQPICALFLGDGEQAREIAGTDGCQVQPFAPYPELGRYYRAADVGVWPCQESISMLDAAACGLPIVVGDRIKARERYEGNGLTFAENDPSALAEQLMRLRDSSLRSQLGHAGVDKMRRIFSVERVADILLDDYREALNRERGADAQKILDS
jgi:glycosyltransferase involved in cell wall biosynthesis